MFRKLMLACVLLMFAVPGMAVESKASGGYIGGGLGMSKFNDDGAFDGFSYDDTDTGGMIFGGYKFGKHFALEGRYTDYGSFSLMGAGFDVSALSVHAVGSIPFGTSGWELFGQLGFGQVSLDVVGDSTDESAFAAGIGIRYSFSERLSVAAQSDLFIWQDSSLGQTYDLTVGSNLVSVQYIF
ncbi:MAG: porin family protein [Gammaproteobacteria bacterium]|nr:porin family protein [Gammaproteobacteria bacterium]